MAATKKRRTNMSNERLAVVETNLENVVTQTSQTQSDVKTVLAEIGSLKVTLAMLPTWDAIKAMDSEQKKSVETVSTRVTTLETAKAGLKATWATILVVCVVISTLVGWGISIFVH